MASDSNPLRVFPEILLENGTTRRVLADSPELMVVAFGFPKGAEGARHRHPHVQSTYVRSGRFRFTLGDTSFEVGPGDSFVIPSNLPHGCVALEEGVLIDGFSPRREDFL